MSNSDMTVYRAAKLFTYLCVRDDTLYGFKVTSGKLIMLTTKGQYAVSILQPASAYDDCMYVKYKGIVYMHNPHNKELPWSGVCHV